MINNKHKVHSVSGNEGSDWM